MPPRRRPKVLDLRPPWTPAAIEDLGHVSDRKIATVLGITARAVRAERERRDIAPTRPGLKPRHGVAMTVRRAVWLSEEEAAADDAARGDLDWSEWDRRARAAARGGDLASFRASLEPEPCEEHGKKWCDCDK